MARTPDIGNVQLYPDRPLRKSDKNGYTLKFYCPLAGKRIRKNCGTRDRTEARKILKECSRRLIGGEYESSNGAITAKHELHTRTPLYLRELDAVAENVGWNEAFEKYLAFKEKRLRTKSISCLSSSLQMVERILEARRANDSLPPGVTLMEAATLSSLEFLQEQLLEGAEGQYESRATTTVNSIVSVVMAFLRYCHKHGWIEKLPAIDDLDEDEAMRGRPITGEEFDRIINTVPKVVGNQSTDSWRFLLRVLWETGFRIADVLNFYWDDDSKIHPVCNSREKENWKLLIPSTQKNGKFDEIPMLPALASLLEQVPVAERQGRVAKLQPVEFDVPGKKEGAFTPRLDDLARLIVDYSNCSIAKACNVSEQTVRKWILKSGLERQDSIRCFGEEIPEEAVTELKTRSAKKTVAEANLSTDRVSRIICSIGQEAGVIVRSPNEQRGTRIKYASAHDLRRSFAERLYNRGMSAETLMVLMRHRDFTTTRKFYGAKRRAESASREVYALLGSDASKSELVGGLVGGIEKAPQLSAEELKKLKALLNAI